MMTPISDDEMQEFFDFLQGQGYDEMLGAPPPDRVQLTSKQAFEVIFHLQEMGALPEEYEQCSTCGALFNSLTEGVFTDSSDPAALRERGYAPRASQMDRHYCSVCARLIPEA